MLAGILRRGLLAIALLLLAVSCQATAEVTLINGSADRPGQVAQAEPPTTASAADSGVDIDADPDQLAQGDTVAPAPQVARTVPEGGRIDLTLTRDDVPCDEDDLNVYSDTSFVVAHVVVDGNLGAACWGTPDDRLVQAWRVLSRITPPAQLSDLGLFGGYESSGFGETTLAYVNNLDYEGEQFQMSINLDEAAADPDELQLTMAHEFSHVFTSRPDQLDRFVLPDECETWDNGLGCFTEDSLMWEWIQTFWADGLLNSIDPLTEPTNDAGQQLCAINPAFLGTYAASHPEEDFAEAFSAFVFRLDVRTPELEAKMDWFAQQPGLAEFRERAINAGLGPLRNDFALCGG